MRKYLLLTTTILLGACGGGGGAGPDVVSAPPPVSGGNKQGTFVSPTDPKTYQGIGAYQVYEYSTDSRECCGQQQQVYAGTATTARDSEISIAYDPRDAVYTLQITDASSGAETNTRFQDPASLTDFDGALEPQWGTPELSNPNIAYLQAGDGDPRSPYRVSGAGFINAGNNDIMPDGQVTSSYQATSLFVLKPGSETQYVTYAGYVRNAFDFVPLGIEDATGGDDGEGPKQIAYHLERGAFAYGQVSDFGVVPKTGSASFNGSMLASMIFNPTFDGQSGGSAMELPSLFQWIEGTASLNVDFAASTLNIALSGTALAPQLDRFSFEPGSTGLASVIAQGAAFSANGEGTINLANFGGFKGEFSQAGFVNPDGTRYDVNIAGSSLDGAFYGPAAEEVGGGFRIVGGNPDERIDILGAFIGK